jgi:hypothetical protein
VRLARALQKLEGSSFAQDSHKVTVETEQPPSKVTPENPSNLFELKSGAEAGI